MVNSLTRLGIVLTAGIFLSTTLFAAEANGPTTIPLPQLEAGQEMRILTVDLAPGQASQPHRHNAYVFVYVLEGVVEMQVRGGPLMQLGPGDMFFENPDDIHQVSRNASNTETAKFLVHMLKKESEPVTVQVDD